MSAWVNCDNAAEEAPFQTRIRIRSVNIQRSYRDGDDTKFVSNFTMADLPAVIHCLQLAQEHVEKHEAGVA